MADLSGQRLGPFEIRSLIGTGGFATVYRAHDPRLGTEVALKILAENHSLDPTIRQRFLGEANALRRVDSPSVVRIYDIRETPDARPYLVLEFADRGDLVGRRRELTANGWTPTLADVRAIVESLAEALDAVHAEDLVHRDITPSNVLIRSGRRTTSRPGVMLIEPDERFMLSDMGLVKDLSAGSSLTVGGGTAGFWAPEQQHAMASVDHRTDIYSASALLVWLLSSSTVTTDPTWDDTLRAQGWPPQLVTEMLRGLALDPTDRHQTIREWEAALMAALSEPAPGVVFEPPAQPAAAPLGLAQAPAAPEPGAPVPPTTVSDAIRAEPVAGQQTSRNGALIAVAAVVAAALIGLVAFLLLRGGTTEVAGDGTASDSEVPEQTATVAPAESSAGAGQSNEPQSQGAPDDETTPPTGPVIEQVMDTWAMATHGNGSQLMVEQVAVSADRTTVEFVAINGRDFDTRFDADDRTTQLVDGAGATYALLEEMTIKLVPGEIATFSLDFAPLQGAVSDLTVEFNARGDDEQSEDEGFPGFVVEVDLSQPISAPALPPSVLIDDVDVHPNGATVRITGLAFSETNIAAGVIGTAGGRRSAFSSGHQASFLEDDLGNRYWLKFEFDERFIRVDEGFEVTGTLVFAGRIHPDASTLRLVLNHEESGASSTTSSPKFELGPWPLDGSFPGVGSFDAIAVQDARTHPNSVDVEVQSIEFDATVSRASLNILNNRRTAVYLNSCCDNSYLLDDLGNRYLLFGLGTNDDLRIPTEERLDGAALFVGAIDPAASSIEIIINDRDEGGLDDPDTSWPEFVFGPFDLVRRPVDIPLGFDPADFGTFSRWEIARAG